MEYNLLDKLGSVADIKKLKIEELEQLAAEIRALIIETTKQTGGHLASALGAVDIIVALYYVYDFPNDKLIFDVGHQAYAHKILSDRYKRFSTLRQDGGISGFPVVSESCFDSFGGGHAGTSIAAGLGYLYSRDKLNQNFDVVDFVGDGSFFNGENLEALFSTDKKPEGYLVVFNDNGMSISKNSNGLYKLFSNITIKKSYVQTKHWLKKVLGNGCVSRFLKNIKSSFKHTLTPNSALDLVGLKYVGVYDGHDMKTLVKVISRIKQNRQPTFLHLKTKKGKGYKDAENQAEIFHGVGANHALSVNTFSDSLSNILCGIAQKNPRIVALTAGMAYGTGLKGFAEKHPDKFVDGGIAEEFMLSYAAGIALSGITPIVCIYSTFMQRAYDQIMTDVCMQNLPVVLCLDRAGAVGADGQTHQGLFDISYLGHIPNLTLLSPKDVSEFAEMLEFAVELKKPVAIRYPNGKCEEIGSVVEFKDYFGWEVLKKCGECRLVIYAVGPRMNALALAVAAEYNFVDVVNARVVNKLDLEIMKNYSSLPVITLEENILSGGFGERVASYLAKNKANVETVTLGFKDEFVPHASVKKQLEDAGLCAENLRKIINSINIKK